MYKPVIIAIFIILGLNGSLRADVVDDSDGEHAKKQTSCNGQLTQYDPQSQYNLLLRSEFANKFEKLLLLKMASGELSKNDALKGPLFKIQGQSIKGFFYIIKGEKALYLFGEKRRWFGRAPALGFAAMPLSAQTSNTGSIRYEITTKYFHSSLNRAGLDGIGPINQSIDLGPFGVISYFNTGTWPDFYELQKPEAVSSTSYSSPEEILKQMKGDSSDQVE